MDTIARWMEIAAVEAGLRIAFVLLAGVVLTRLLRLVVRRLQKKVSAHAEPARALQRAETLARVLTSAGIVVIWSVSGIYVLSVLGFQLAPLLAGVGIVGLAVGFGAQDLVKDVVNGFFILLEDQFGVGDILQINQGPSGKVEQLTLRVTGLRDLDGTLHFISNGTITHVANRSKDWARAVIDVGVGYGEDPSHVRSVLEDVAAETSDDDEIGSNLYAKPEILGVEALGEYEVVWRVIADTKPGKQWEASRQIREVIKRAFDAENIEIPFPHRVMVTAGDSKAGDSKNE
ncbi:MAG: mechanosensitive ion channel family protein [Actinomycetota bacterium]